MKITQAALKRKKTRLILSNGSERSDFVAIDEIFTKLGRIHDGIQILKTYYPDDPAWSPIQKISEITAKKNVTYAWDYEYEDYQPFDIWEEKSTTRDEIEALKSYGADLHLTLTLDLDLSDREIACIAQALEPYGKVFLRINHEANGNWFRFSRQHTHQEVSDFFVRCHKIIKNNSANIYTVFNLTGDYFVNEGVVVDRFLYLENNRLQGALNIADYWSIDKYVTLNYGWPFQKVNENSTMYFRKSVEQWWQLVEETYLKMIWHNNLIAKPLFINEFNSDSDVDGYKGQAANIMSVYNRLAKGEFEWLAGITLYQFRDYGGLGLEKGNLLEYKSLPALKAYQKAIRDFKYDLEVEFEEWQYPDYTFVWNDSDNIRGLRISKLSGKKQLINRFDFPLFVVYGKEQMWVRIEKNEILQMDDLNELILLVPPFKDEKGRINYSIIIRDFKTQLEEMII